MKGYFTKFGYLGYADGKWMLFATESDYYDYVEDAEDDTK